MPKQFEVSALYGNYINLVATYCALVTCIGSPPYYCQAQSVEVIFYFIWLVLESFVKLRMEEKI